MPKTVAHISLVPVINVWAQLKCLDFVCWFSKPAGASHLQILKQCNLFTLKWTSFCLSVKFFKQKNAFFLKIKYPNIPIYWPFRTWAVMVFDNFMSFEKHRLCNSKVKMNCKTQSKYISWKLANECIGFKIKDLRILNQSYLLFCVYQPKNIKLFPYPKCYSSIFLCKDFFPFCNFLRLLSTLLSSWSLLFSLFSFSYFILFFFYIFSLLPCCFSPPYKYLNFSWKAVTILSLALHSLSSFSISACFSLFLQAVLLFSVSLLSCSYTNLIFSYHCRTFFSTLNCSFKQHYPFSFSTSHLKLILSFIFILFLTLIFSSLPSCYTPFFSLSLIYIYPFLFSHLYFSTLICYSLFL